MNKICIVVEQKEIKNKFLVASMRGQYSILKIWHKILEEQEEGLKLKTQRTMRRKNKREAVDNSEKKATNI